MALAHLPGHRPRRDLDVPEAIEMLFDVDPEDFVVARDRLARRLRAAGLVDDAESVRSMVAPTRAAWALNRVARSCPERVHALLASARELRVAQDACLAGGADADLRSAQREFRRRVLDLVGDAQKVLGTAGVAVTPLVAPLTALAESVMADADQADALGQGRLTGLRSDPIPGGQGEVITLEDHRATVVRHRLDGQTDHRRSVERDRLHDEQRELRRRLQTVTRHAEEVALDAAAAMERVVEARRRLEQAEVAARTAAIERQRLERELVSTTRALRQVDQRLGQVDDLLAARHRSSRPTR